MGKGYYGVFKGHELIEFDVLKTIMKDIKENDYPKSKQVENFIKDVIEHFENIISGQ